MSQAIQVQPLIQEPLFDPTYLNLEYVFRTILDSIYPVIDILKNPQTWSTLGVITSLFSIFCIAIIIYSIVRMREIQLHEKEEIAHEIHHALAMEHERRKAENPRWHYIRTLIEGASESDWRVAIIEADTMLDESLEAKGWSGVGVGEKLERGKGGGLHTLQNAWDAHKVRNQIAHAGSDFALSQTEGRRVIKLFQTVFEELGVI
ncbi:MAG: hypothetical protein KBB75_02520 [Candidatus Pacebacteria bacterium]|jgi:hypothetical protein|nr:hypothetical protein [Candidatus Paceibacterota bacterium]